MVGEICKCLVSNDPAPKSLATGPLWKSQTGLQGHSRVTPHRGFFLWIYYLGSAGRLRTDSTGLGVQSNRPTNYYYDHTRNEGRLENHQG